MFSMENYISNIGIMTWWVFEEVTAIVETNYLHSQFR